MSDIQRLRQKSLMDSYDQLTPGASGGGYAPPQYEEEQAVLPSTNIYGAPPSGLGQIAQQQQQSIAPPRVDPNASLQRTVDAINQVYTPETVSRDRYNNLLDNTPVREAPGVGRSIFASLLSLKSDDPLKTAEQVMYAPHMRNMQDWSARTTPFKDAAQLENTANINERTLAGNVVNAQTQADRLAESARVADERNRITEEKNRQTNEIAQKKNEIAYAKANGAKFETRGAMVIATFPDGRVINTGVPTTAFSPFELENLRQGGRMQLEAARTAGDIAVKQTPPGGKTGSGTLSPLDAARQRTSRMEEAYLTMEGADKYIHQSGSGRFTMDPRPVLKPETWYGKGNAAEVAQWDKLMQAVDPNYKIPGSGIPKDIPSTGTPAAMPKGVGNTPTKPGQVGDYTEGDIPARPNYKTQTDRNNPQNKRRTLDGKTWEISHDGGKTWGKG